jgi:hypothetical protein
MHRRVRDVPRPRALHRHARRLRGRGRHDPPPERRRGVGSPAIGVESIPEPHRSHVLEELSLGVGEGASAVASADTSYVLHGRSTRRRGGGSGARRVARVPARSHAHRGARGAHRRARGRGPAVQADLDAAAAHAARVERGAGRAAERARCDVPERFGPRSRRSSSKCRHCASSSCCGCGGIRNYPRPHRLRPRARCLCRHGCGSCCRHGCFV